VLPERSEAARWFKRMGHESTATADPRPELHVSERLLGDIEALTHDIGGVAGRLRWGRAQPRRLHGRVGPVVSGQ
jgi:hypothetical protein